MRRRRWEIIIALLLLICVAMVYGGVLRAEFVRWDDDILLYNNPHLTGLNAPALRWMWSAFDYVVRYQPLTWLTWATIAQCTGIHPFAYHLVSVILHGLNACLVFLLMRALLLRTGMGVGVLPEQRAKYAAICAGAGALVWAVHPMRVEVAAWASALLHCQALFFLLLAALFYLKAHTVHWPAPRRRILYWAAFASYAASLLSYPIGLGFTVVLVVLDVWVLRRFPSGLHGWLGAEGRRIWFEKLPFLGAALAVVAITVWARLHVSGGWLQSPSLDDFSLGHRLMQACYIWAYYLWRPLVPFDLSPVYTTLLSFRPADAAFGRSLMLLLVVTIVLVTQRQRWPMALALWMTHLILLVPVLGLTEHPHYPNDRYSYAVGILWSVALGAGLFALTSRPRPFAVALGGCLALAGIFGVFAERQTRIWRDSSTLFRYAIAQLGDHPYRADIHWRLGIALTDEGKLDEAVANYRIALSLAPDFAEAHHHLAVALERQHKSAEALEHYLAALRLMPDYAEAHCGAGLILAEQGRKDQAAWHLRRAAALDPKLPGIREKLSALLDETK